MFSRILAAALLVVATLPAQAADKQWAQVLARPVRPTEDKTRQGDFTPVETLLCFAASLTVNTNRYSGRTAHLMPTPKCGRLP